MKLNRISLPLLERSGWGDAAANAVRSVLTGGDSTRSSCAMLGIAVEAEGGCAAQTTKAEFIKKIDLTEGAGKGKAKYAELAQLIQQRKTLPMPNKPDGTQYDKESLQATYVEPAEGARQCAKCMFYVIGKD
jgi:hypothetical protein